MPVYGRLTPTLTSCCLRQAGHGCQHAGKDKFPDHIEPSQVNVS